MSDTGNTHITTTHPQAYRCTSGVETRKSNQVDSTHTYIHSLRPSFLFFLFERQSSFSTFHKPAVFGCRQVGASGCATVCYPHLTGIGIVHQSSRSRKGKRLEINWVILPNFLNWRKTLVSIEVIEGPRASISPHRHLIVKHFRKGGSSQV